MPHDLHTFAKTRGFTAQELEEHGIRIEGDEVVIPLLGRKGHVWYERRHRPGGSPKYLSPSGVEPHLYNPLGLGPHSDEVWIAEGEFDTLSLIVSGAPAVGVLGVNSFNTAWRHLFIGARVVIAVDPDEAGEKMATQLAGLFPHGTAQRFDGILPFKDINDRLVNDRAGLRRAVLAW